MNETGLVDRWEALSYPSSRARRLLDMARWWSNDPVPHIDGLPRFQPKRKPGLEERIGEAESAKLISRFLAGTTHDELAKYYGTSVSSVKQLLGRHDARLSRRK